MSIEGRHDLEGLRASGRITRRALDAMAREVRAGITTAELNALGAEVIRTAGARSAPMAVYGFPSEVCISINDEVVHGIPSGRALAPGDVVTLDVTVECDGYVTDAALTLPVGTVPPRVAALIACARRGFWKAVLEARAGAPLRRIGRAVQAEARRAGFSVIPELSGHGVGRTIHEPPVVSNYDDGNRTPMTQGLVITVEPILTCGSGRIREATDGWTVLTAEGAVAVHHEETIVVTRGRPIVLTAAA